MMRFAWLQVRTRTVFAVGALAALAIAAAITGVRLSHLYDTLVGSCQGGNCGLQSAAFLSHDQFLQQALDPLAQAVPAIIGIFWGAPLLARELETGTYRLAWTQTVPRSRWLLTKLGVNGLATVIVTGLLTLTVTWWYRAIDIVGSDRYAMLDRRDIAPIGYAAFAFAIGAFLGAVLRRTVPAMASTLAVFVFARIATTLWLRPHLIPPMHRASSLLHGPQFGFLAQNGSPVTLVAQGQAPPGAWVLSTSFITTSGRPATSADLSAFVQKYCAAIAKPSGAPSSQTAFEACRVQAARSFHLLVAYQPANRYWAFQWVETGIFLVLAMLAVAACCWWVTRRTV